MKRLTRDPRKAVLRLAEAMGAVLEVNGKSIEVMSEGVELVRPEDFPGVVNVRGSTWVAMGHLLTVAMCSIFSNGLGWTAEEARDAMRWNPPLTLHTGSGRWMISLPEGANASVEAIVCRVYPRVWLDAWEAGETGQVHEREGEEV